MSELADGAARHLIEDRLDLNLIVEAGAGSGKTHSLANRMAAGIVTGNYEVEGMAAVTFTRKAAAEIRGRFQLALEGKLKTARGEERLRIEKALANLEHLFAGTIHSFCAHLLRERPVEAGIGPGFTELDEIGNEELRQRSWRDYLSRLRGQGSPLVEELQRARISAKDLDRAFATVCMFDEVEFPPGDARAPDVKAALKATQSFWKKLQALMPKPVAPDAKCAALAEIRRFRGLLRAAGSGRGADLVQALRCWEKPPDVTMKWWAAGREEGRAVREKVEQLAGAFKAETVDVFLSAWRPYLYRLVMTLLADARSAAREERRRALALNYGDLLTAAADLLRGNAGVRAALQQKYRWLFVDEFQDTDPIQAEVMLLLAGDDRAGGGGRGAEVRGREAEGGGRGAEERGREAAGGGRGAERLRPGALFVVGDPKQSIYRFRRADIDIYHRVREVIVANGGRVVTLTTSFRAKPELCEWTNGAFEGLLPAEASSVQAAFSPLDANPGWKPHLAPAPETGGQRGAAGETGLRTLTIPAEVSKVDDVAAWDADAIARFIRAEVDARRANWSDFLILTRKKKHLPIYAWALQRLEVPVEVAGAGAFGGSETVQAVIDLAHALGDPANTSAVVGVLRGPLFGISDAELFAHRQSGGYFSFPTAGKTGSAAKGTGSPVSVALARLGDYLQLARTQPLAAAVEQILEDTGFLALAAAGGAGGAQAGDVLHAVDLVREAAEKGGSLADAAAALELAAESNEIESVPLEPGRRDVVRVMNLHKAKGLEASVVFLADPLGGVKKGVDVRIVRDSQTARGYLAVKKKIGEYAAELIAHPTDWGVHETAEMAYVEAEDTRLLYVAATRAREMLVVSRLAKGGKGQRPWSALDAHVFSAPAIDSPDVRPAAAKATVDVSPKARTRATVARLKRREAAGKASWAKTAVTGGNAEGGKAEDGGRGAEDGGRGAEGGQAEGLDGNGELRIENGEGPPRRGPDGRRRDAGPAWGSLVHGLLEHAMKHPNAAPENLERLARWLTVESPELRPVIPEALKLVQVVSRAPFWEVARAGGEFHAEVPFAVRIEAGESPGSLGAVDVPTILRGVIDLVYRGADGWRILDYKTDIAAAAGESLAARHAPQLAQYRGAWERITGEKVAGVGIVALRTSTVEWA